MKIIYKNAKVERQCTSAKEATKLFGGDKALVTSLFSRINALEAAKTIKDIIVQRQMHFHKLQGNYDGNFAIDVKSRRDAWRIILRPLDENENVFDPCNIDEIAELVEIVEVKEVSNHYD